MKELISDLKSDEAFYLTNIALATTSLATATLALQAQVAKAVSASGTYGFNGGLELSIEALETQQQHPKCSKHPPQYPKYHTHRRRDNPRLRTT